MLGIALVAYMAVLGGTFMWLVRDSAPDLSAEVEQLADPGPPEPRNPGYP